jgi:hypothetical protein
MRGPPQPPASGVAAIGIRARALGSDLRQFAIGLSAE